MLEPPVDLAERAVSEQAQPDAGFVCVCAQKSIEFNVVDHKLHRANKDQELREELEKLSCSAFGKNAFQLGGGCRVIGSGSKQRPIHIASWGESVAAFEGTLSNIDDLVKAYPIDTSGHTTITATAHTANTNHGSDAAPLGNSPVCPAPEHDSCTPKATSMPSTVATISGLEAAEAAPEPPSSSSEAGVKPPSANAREPEAHNPALVVCIMYDTIGQELLGLLRGRFSFCLYHGKTGRVLAARDSSGTIPLFQGLSAAQSLVISSREEFTTTCHEVKAFEPGFFKYGWYAEPRRFSTSKSNHHHGHANHQNEPNWGRGGSSRSSLDVCRPAVQQGSARSSLDHGPSGRPSMEQGRGSARSSMDQGRTHARGSLDHGRPASRASMDASRHGVSPGMPSQQAAAARAGAEERSWTARKSLDRTQTEAGRAMAAAAAFGEQAQTQAVKKGGAEPGAMDGWSVVSAKHVGAGRTPSGRKSLDAGAFSKLRVAPQERRQSVDAKGVDQHPQHLHRPLAPILEPGASTENRQTSRRSGDAAAFKFDVNAPAFKPPQAV